LTLHSSEIISSLWRVTANCEEMNTITTRNKDESEWEGSNQTMKK
jgi:hypothetical protein